MPNGDLPEPANATTIFVLGLLGILVCGILGIVAFFMGRGYKEQVAQGLVKKNGLAEAGYVLGLVSMILLVLWIILFLFVGLGAIFSSGMTVPG